MKQDNTNYYFNLSALFILAVLWIVFIFNSFFTNLTNHNAASDNLTLIERIKPIGNLYIEGDIDIAVVTKPAKTQISKQRTGKQIYDAFCSSCHNIGVAAAPKLGSKTDWTPRIKQGIKTLVTTAIKGKGAMPPKGACSNCSEADINTVVTYMINSIK